MTSIEFYILTEDAPLERLQLVDELIDKSMRAGRSVHIHTSSATSRQTLIERYRDYLPDEAVGLSICHTTEPADHMQVLVNLAPEVPHFFSRFEKTLEIIDSDQQTRLLGRERYQYYRHRGYPLKHFDIDAASADLPRQNRMSLV